MDKRVAIKEWSLSMRANHWLMALSIFILIPTGFYIYSPITVLTGETGSKFLMGSMRYVHILFGTILTFVFIWRIYMMFFSRFHADFKDFFAWTNFKNFWTQIKFYALISEEKPQHTHLYGPLQSLAYGGLIVMWLLIVITGLVLMGANHDGGIIGAINGPLLWIGNLLGGLGIVRYIHHVLTWLFIIFIVVHLYMAFWYDVVFKEGTVSSMISGRVFRKIEE